MTLKGRTGPCEGDHPLQAVPVDDMNLDRVHAPIRGDVLGHGAGPHADGGGPQGAATPHTLAVRDLGGGEELGQVVVLEVVGVVDGWQLGGHAVLERLVDDVHAGSPEAVVERRPRPAGPGSKDSARSTRGRARLTRRGNRAATAIPARSTTDCTTRVWSRESRWSVSHSEASG